MRQVRPPTPNEFLVLTLLGEGPCTGYDLDRKVAERRLREWTGLGTSGLYFILEALRRRGWVRARRERSPDGPARRVCSITRRGRGALLRRARAALAIASRPAPEPDMAMMNLFRFGRAAFARLLRAHERATAAMLAETRRARSTRPWGTAARLIFARHVAVLGAERKWAAKAARVVEKDEGRRW